MSLYIWLPPILFAISPFVGVGLGICVTECPFEKYRKDGLDELME